MDTSIDAAPRQTFRSSILFAILLIVLGILAISLPMVASIGVARVISWLILIDGIFQFVYAFRSKGVGHTIWKLLVSLLYIAAGVYLLANPLLGLTGLTLLLAMFFFIYIPVIRGEEKFLREHFPEFDEYARQVPRMFPRFGRPGNAANTAPAAFSPNLYIKHREYNAALGSMLLLLALIIRMIWFR